MTDKKFTDDEIIKDLKQCEECHYYGECEKSVRKAIDIINRLKEENDTLKAMIEAAEDHYNPLPFKGIFDEKIAEARAEAIREFAERLKNRRGTHGELWGGDIDNLVKEMVGEKPCL